MFGEECPDEIIPSADEILSCYYLSENTGLITAVLQTMKESQAGTVEIKEKKGKNGESHASKWILRGLFILAYLVDYPLQKYWYQRLEKLGIW